MRNNEICCNFTHMIITDGIDLENNTLWSNIGGVSMANLKEEYTDIKNIKHHVEHIILSTNDKNRKEQMIEELYYTLTKSNKHISA